MLDQLAQRLASGLQPQRRRRLQRYRQRTVNELLTMVNVALGNGETASCFNGDANRDGAVTIDEILAAVNNALNGCAPVA